MSQLLDEPLVEDSKNETSPVAALSAPPPLPHTRGQIVAATYTLSVAQFERMIEAGILPENEHIELIEGDITEMAAVGKRHASRVKYLNRNLNRLVGDKAIVSVQDPIQLDDLSEPEPDIALLTRRDDFYRHQLPCPADVLLVIEVADSSLEYDRRTKLPLYARAGIREFWLVNLIEERIEIYTEPANGTYTKVAYIRRGEALISVTMPDITLDAEALLA